MYTAALLYYEVLVTLYSVGINVFSLAPTHSSTQYRALQDRNV